MACQVTMVGLANPRIFHNQTKCGHYLGIIPTNRGSSLNNLQYLNNVMNEIETCYYKLFKCTN
jgi:hypothetical protein